MRVTVLCAALAGCSGIALGQSLIGIDFDNGAGSPTNWNTLGAGPHNVANLIDESGASTGVSFTSNTGNTFTTSANAGTLPQHSQSLAGLDDYLFGTSTFTGTFGGLTPGQEYFVWAFGLRGFDMGNDVTITGGGAPIIFDQDESTTGNLWVNDAVGDSSLTLQSYAFVQTADSAGQITFIIADDPIAGGVGWTSAGLAIQIVPAPGAAALLGLGGLAATRRRRA